MPYAGDPDEYRRRLEAKLQPQRISATLAFAGLYQVTHQLITNAVMEQTKGFFGKSPLDDTWWYGEEQFKHDVLSRHKVPFKACLAWLIEMDAIDQTQADRLDAIYVHRNDLSHELMKYVVDPDFEPEVQLFLDALNILASLLNFWKQIEKDVGTYEEYGDIDLDEVTPLSLFVLGMCIEAYGELLDNEPGT